MDAAKEYSREIASVPPLLNARRSILKPDESKHVEAIEAQAREALQRLHDDARAAQRHVKDGIPANGENRPLVEFDTSQDSEDSA